MEICRDTWGVSVTLGLVIWTIRAEDAWELSHPEGFLVPANDPTPPACSDIPLPSGVAAIYLGDSRLHAPPWSPYSPIVTQDGRPILTIEKDPRGRIALTIDIRSRDGKIIARIKKNEFTVNQNNILSMKRPDRSTLIVIDQEGIEAVRLRYLNAYAIRFSGALYIPNRRGRVVIGEHEIDAGNLRLKGYCSAYSEFAGRLLISSE